VLVDFHPNPSVALVDGPQAMLMDELPQFLEDMAACHEFYQSRVAIWAQ
jgi:3-deoxy-7-phosphoheptulonate synthase